MTITGKRVLSHLKEVARFLEGLAEAGGDGVSFGGAKVDQEAAMLSAGIPELIGYIWEAETNHAALHDDIFLLQAQIKALQDRRLQLDGYYLHRLESQAFVYLAEECVGEVGSASHCLCANCYHQQIKSILQPQGQELYCPACNIQVPGAAELTAA